MKRCPNCNTTYTDETLRFCLEDGGQLVPLTGTEKTVSSMSGSEETIAFDRNPVRVDVAGKPEPESVNTFISPSFPPPSQPPSAQPQQGTSSVVVGLLAGLLLVVILGFAGFAAYVFLRPEPKPNDNKDVATTQPTSAKKPADEDKNAEKDDNEDLKEKLANLEKQLEQQQKEANVPKIQPTPAPDGNTARINSPRDGFLALRSDPDTETGFRITKMPHGASVRVLGCRPYSYIGKTRGRWCQVSYAGQTGWAFDAFLRW